METGSRPSSRSPVAPPAAPQPPPPTSERPAGPYTSTGGPRIHVAPPPRRHRFAWAWLLAGVVVVGGLVWLIIPHGDTSGGAAGKRGRFGAGGPPTTVVVGTVAKGDMPVYLNALGAVTPLATVTVQPQIAGYIQSIDFKEGQMVRKGQLLAQIDDRLYRAQLLSAQGSLAKDQAALADARLDLKRYQTLLAQESIASQQVDTQAALVKQDEGLVAVDEAAINTAKVNIAYCHITSPVSGRVGLRQVDVGNYVTSGLATGIVIVTEIAPIDVEFALPEDNLPQVSARLSAGAKLQVVATDRTGATKLATGTLLTLDNQVDATTGTIKAKARFDNGSGSLFPQQFVNVRVLVDTLHNAVIAPSASVLRGSAGLYAFVVQGGQNAHKVTQRTITIGPAAGESTAVLSGLNPGDVVVTDGSDRLTEGAHVILPGDCIPIMRPPGAGGSYGGKRPAGGGLGGKPGAGGGSGACPAGQRPAGVPNAAALSAGAAVGGGPGDASASSGSGPNATPTSPVSSPAINAKPGGTSEAGPASSTSQAGSGGGQAGGGRMQALLSQLNLDAVQQVKAQALFEKARGDAMAAAASAGDDPDAQRNARRQAMAQAFAGLEPILRPDQKAKLAQLRAQMAQGGGGYQGGGGQP